MTTNCLAYAELACSHSRSFPVVYETFNAVYTTNMSASVNHGWSLYIIVFEAGYIFQDISLEYFYVTY